MSHDRNLVKILDLIKTLDRLCCIKSQPLSVFLHCVFVMADDMDTDDVLYCDLLSDEENFILGDEECLSGCSTINEKFNSISFGGSPPRLNWVTGRRSTPSPVPTTPPPRTPENQPIPAVQPVAPKKKRRHSSHPSKNKRLVTKDLKSTVSVDEKAAEERRRRRYHREQKEYEERVHRRERHKATARTSYTTRRHHRRSPPRRPLKKGPEKQPSKPFPEGAPASYHPGVVGGLFRQARNRCTDKFQRVYARWKKDRHSLAFDTSSGRPVSFITLLDDFSKAHPDIPFEQSADSALCLSIIFSSLWDETASPRSAGERLLVPQQMVEFINKTYNNPGC